MFGMLLFIFFASLDAHDHLKQIEAAQFFLVGVNGTIPQHFATIKQNPDLIDRYSQHLEVYHLKKQSLFSKLFINKSADSHILEPIQLPLKSVNKRWINATLKGHYQVVENKKNNKIYVFLGYASGINTYADEIVNAYVL